MKLALRAVLSMGVLATFASPASPQSFVKERYPRIGLPSFSRPRSFEAIPAEPGEKFVKLRFTEKIPEVERGKQRRDFRPKLDVIVIDKPVVTSGPKTEPPQGKVTSITTYARHELPGEWTTEYLAEGKKSRGFVSSQFKLLPPIEYPRNGLFISGYVYAWESPARIVALHGTCADGDWAELSEMWRRVGDRMKIAEPRSAGFEDLKLERLYRQKGLSHAEYRIGVRKALVDDWKAEDTENYIVVHHTKDQPLLRKILRDLELLRLEYMQLFPPQEDFDAVSTVRVCADRDEYIAYGGHPRSAGYWNPKSEELVLYDAEKLEKGKRPDDGDTFIALYHEAFHQYIHYSAGELAPHSWFNEGHGDYFSGATIKNGKVRKIDPSPWRLRTIKLVVSARRHVPLAEIIHWSQSRYYTNPGPAYAQGWAMVYFLNKAEAVQRNPRWAGILTRYFEALKKRWAEELARHGGPTEEAQEAARLAAVEAAFVGIDLAELEREWLAFVEELPERR